MGPCLQGNGLGFIGGAGHSGHGFHGLDLCGVEAVFAHVAAVQAGGADVAIGLSR
ncbi:MAG: hypothetical protein R3E42_18600 [Burkholderiaceae bacterium]